MKKNIKYSTMRRSNFLLSFLAFQLTRTYIPIAAFSLVHHPLVPKQQQQQQFQQRQQPPYVSISSPYISSHYISSRATVTTSTTTLWGKRGGRGSGKSSSSSEKKKKVSKSNLPQKDCVVCGRPFTWRKKWERCWDEVTCCSKSCNAKRRSGPD